MKKYLLIAEKPSLMREIQTVFNEHKNEFDFDIKFMAQAGHLIALKLPHEINEEEFKEWNWDMLPITPDSLGGFKYKVIPDKAKLFNDIKTEINSGKYDALINSSDSDMEGEYLFTLVSKYAKNKLPIKRFWCSDLTEKSILDALHNLRDDDNEDFFINLRKAAYARSEADYLVGMNLSPASSLKLNSRVAIGRVKSPLLKIIVDRELAIRNFKPSTSYELVSNYKEGFNGTLFEETKETDEDGKEKIKQENIRFNTKEECEMFSKKLSDKFNVLNVERKIEKTSAPELFKLATIQIEGSKLGYNSDKVLSLVQSLYEKKYLSYPRTSCSKISSTMDCEAMLKSVSVFSELKPYVDKITKADIENVKKNKKYVDDKAVNESSHYALSPTTEIPDLSKLDKDELIILEMVFRQFLAIFLPPVISDKTTIITENNGNLFKSNGKVVKDKGYTVVLKTSFNDVELPNVSKGDILNLDKWECAEKTTTCPKRFTDGDLIQIMENPVKYLENEGLKSAIKSSHGIGTAATRASIIKQLINKDKYIERKKGKSKTELIFATDLGIQIVEKLGDRKVFQVDMTAEWENKLEALKLGQLDKEEFDKGILEYIIETIDDIKNSNLSTITVSKNSVGTCPLCGGSILEGDKGFYCSEWKTKECPIRIPKVILGAKITASDVNKLISGKHIKKKVSKDDKTWEQEFELKDGKLEFVKSSNESNYKCPKCGKPLILSEKSVYCSGYKEKLCDYGISRNILGAKFTDKDIDNLFNEKEIVKKVSKEDKTWEQAFKLDSEGKLLFIKKDNSTGLKCPKCGGDIIETPKCFMCKSCFNDKDFSYMFNKTFNEAKISLKDIEKMISGSKIKKKMTSKKTGKEFEGYISIKDGKYDLSFDKK